MFLSKYVDEFYYNLMIDTYTDDYLSSLDEGKFIDIYRLFKRHNFYFIEDIILKYLDIFELDCDFVEEQIINLRNRLGNDYVKIIGNDMRYLDEIVSNYLEE